MKSTKELAKELGLLKTKPKVTNYDKEGFTQLFSYLIVLDFESTCWQNDKFRSQEIIEFPAVLLNLRTGEVEAEFHSYVQPQENPILSQFCTQLTGISQEQVDEGIPLFICLKKFSAWLNQQSKIRKFTFPPKVTNTNACFLTWSDWDLSVCLHYECQRKQLRRPPEMDYWIDLRATYRRFYNRRPNGLKGALQEVGITFEGREHSGLHDSRNTAMLVKKIMLDGCRLQVTKSIHPNVNLASLNGNLWKCRASLRSSVKSDPKQNSEESQENTKHEQQCSSDRQAVLPCTDMRNDVEMWLNDSIDDSDILCASLSEGQSKGEELQPISEGRVQNRSVPTDKVQQSRSKAIETSSSSIALDNSDVVVTHCGDAGTDGVSPDPLINKRCTAQENLQFISSVKKEGVDKENVTFVGNRTFAKSSGETPRTPLTSINKNLPFNSNNYHSLVNINKGFLSPNECSTSFRKDLHETFTGSDSKNVGQNRSLFKRTSVNNSFALPVATSMISPDSSRLSNTSCSSRMMRSMNSLSSEAICRTPPLCGCGCRSKRKLVRNGGPNQGRTFFSCPQKAGCKFFQWEFKENRPSANVSIGGMQTSSLFDITSSYVNSR